MSTLAQTDTGNLRAALGARGVWPRSAHDTCPPWRVSLPCPPLAGQGEARAVSRTRISCVTWRNSLYAPGRLTGGLLQALRLNASNGGRGWDRTSDLSDVNRAL